MMRKVLFLFLATSFTTTSAELYTSGSTEVEVETTILDENNSTRKCVTYLKNAPEKYETACFTSTYTDGATFQGCTMQFNNNAGERCEECSACEDFEQNVGFRLDCDSIIPAKSNLNDQIPCTLLNDRNIQTLLTDESSFLDSTFDFSIDATNVVEDDSNKEPISEINRKTSSVGVQAGYGNFVATAIIVLTLHAF